MSRPPHRGLLTMAVHPSSRGFGWVVYEGPFSPYDWGLVKPTKNTNQSALRRLERLLDRYQPETLVLEECGKARSCRVNRLCQAFTSLAAARGIDLAVYRREEVQGAFASVGARTRHEIAEAVARHSEVFRHRLPKRRRPWDPEDPRMALFSAGAVVLTHYQLGASTLFEELQKEPPGHAP